MVDRLCHARMINNKRGWMIATSIFVLNFFIFGVVHSFSLVLVELQRDFNSTVTTVGSIGSITSATVSFMTPVSCLLYELTTHRIVAVIGVILCSLGILASSFATDVRVLLFTFGIVFGTGANFLYNPLMNLISYYFPEKQSARVTSFGASGASLGSLVLSPLMYLLLPMIGWRTVFRGYSGVIVIFGLACCKTLSPPPPIHRSSLKSPQPELTETTSSENNAFMKYIRILKTWEHWLFNLAIFFGSSAVFFYVFYLVSIMESFDISSDRASNQLVISSATQILGRLFCILFGDRLPISRPMTLAINGLLGAASTLLLLFGVNYAQLVVFTSVSGFVIGVHFSLIYSAGIEIFGLERNSESVAYTIISIGVSTLSMPIVYGIWYDITGSYRTPIFISAIAWAFSAVFFILATMYHKRSVSYRCRYSGVSSTDKGDIVAGQASSLYRIRLEEKAKVDVEL